MSSLLDTPVEEGSLITALGLDDQFRPETPSSIAETGLSDTFVEDLVLRYLLSTGSACGRSIADTVCLPLPLIEDRIDGMRSGQLIAPTGSAMLGDYVYQLTEKGQERGQRAMAQCTYVGPAPVPLEDYVNSVGAQSIQAEKPKRTQLEKAFSDIHVESEMFDRIGPAVTAGKGMFVYGAPGNGKTTLASRITHCYGQNILIPHAIIEGGQIIKLFDAACHQPVITNQEGFIKKADHDPRWIRISRPTVVVGGELQMDHLELKHNSVANISEASLQLKSNCGCLLIDDFGRQRIDPSELLNRWIIPLENGIDYLNLATGKKIEVPFDQLIIFSTNLEPTDLADEAFLRRIPFKVHVGNPSPDEFRALFEEYAESAKVTYEKELVDYLLTTHYQDGERQLRRCHPRDLINHVTHFCEYHEQELMIDRGRIDHAVRNYFTAVGGDS